MTVAVDAIFENGVFKPVNPLRLEEHQKVHLIVQTAAPAQNSAKSEWHWRESQAIEDGFGGAVAEELDRHRREG
jgi:predicted DNA-binding antitoxin AbrB/MazE fold protein